MAESSEEDPRFAMQNSTMRPGPTEPAFPKDSWSVPNYPWDDIDIEAKSDYLKRTMSGDVRTEFKYSDYADCGADPELYKTILQNIDMIPDLGETQETMEAYWLKETILRAMERDGMAEAYYDNKGNEVASTRGEKGPWGLAPWAKEYLTRVRFGKDNKPIQEDNADSMAQSSGVEEQCKSCDHSNDPSTMDKIINRKLKEALRPLSEFSSEINPEYYLDEQINNSTTESESGDEANTFRDDQTSVSENLQADDARYSTEELERNSSNETFINDNFNGVSGNLDTNKMDSSIIQPRHTFYELHNDVDTNKLTTQTLSEIANHSQSGYLNIMEGRLQNQTKVEPYINVNDHLDNQSNKQQERTTNNLKPLVNGKSENISLQQDLQGHQHSELSQNDTSSRWINDSANCKDVNDKTDTYSKQKAINMENTRDNILEGILNAERLISRGLLFRRNARLNPHKQKLATHYLTLHKFGLNYMKKLTPLEIPPLKESKGKTEDLLEDTSSSPSESSQISNSDKPVSGLEAMRRAIVRTGVRHNETKSLTKEEANKGPRLGLEGIRRSMGCSLVDSYEAGKHKELTMHHAHIESIRAATRPRPEIGFEKVKQNYLKNTTYKSKDNGKASMDNDNEDLHFMRENSEGRTPEMYSEPNGQEMEQIGANAAEMEDVLSERNAEDFELTREDIERDASETYFDERNQAVDPRIYETYETDKDVTQNNRELFEFIGEQPTNVAPKTDVEQMRQAMGDTEADNSQTEECLSEKNTEDFDSIGEEENRHTGNILETESEFEAGGHDTDHTEAENYESDKVEEEQNAEQLEPGETNPIILTPETDVEARRRNFDQLQAESYISDIWMANRKIYDYLGDQNPFANTPPDPQKLMEIYGPRPKGNNKQIDSSARGSSALDKELNQRQLFQKCRSESQPEENYIQSEQQPLENGQLDDDGNISPNQVNSSSESLHVHASSRSDVIDPEYNVASRQFEEAPIEEVDYKAYDSKDEVMHLYRPVFPPQTYRHKKNLPVTDTNLHLDTPFNQSNPDFSHQQVNSKSNIKEMRPPAQPGRYSKQQQSKYGGLNKDKQNYTKKKTNDHSNNNHAYHKNSSGSGKKVSSRKKTEYGEDWGPPIPYNSSVIQYGQQRPNPGRYHPSAPQFPDPTGRYTNEPYPPARGPGDYKPDSYLPTEASPPYDPRQQRPPFRYPNTPECPSIPYGKYKPPNGFPEQSPSFGRKQGDYYNPLYDRKIYNTDIIGFGPPYNQQGHAYENNARPYYNSKHYPGYPYQAKYPMAATNDPYLNYHPNLYGSEQYPSMMQPPEVNNRYYYPPPPQHYPYYSWYGSQYSPDQFWQSQARPREFSSYQYEVPARLPPPPPADGNATHASFQQLDRLRAEEDMKYMQYPPRDWYARPYSNNYDDQKSTPTRPFYQTGSPPFIESTAP